MLNYLRKKPDLNLPFRLMREWESIPDSVIDSEAQEKYIKGRIEFDFDRVCNEKSAVELLAFLRYDYKKAIVRTRWLYLDRWCDPNSRILTSANPDLDAAYFEPVLICFPALEFLGRINFPDFYKPESGPKQGRDNSSEILGKILANMGNGYQLCSEPIINVYRHALAHELRPESSREWQCNLCTEENSQSGDSYSSPQMRGPQVFLNVPHLIDSTICEIEKICELLSGASSLVMVEKFCLYWKKRKRKRS